MNALGFDKSSSRIESRRLPQIHTCSVGCAAIPAYKQYRQAQAAKAEKATSYSAFIERSVLTAMVRDVAMSGRSRKVKAPDFSEAPYRAKGVHPPSRLNSSDLATVVAHVNRRRVKGRAYAIEARSR
jgi:hypothetical protein